MKKYLTQFILLFFLPIGLLSNTNIIIGTGSESGVYYPTGNNICKMIPKSSNIKCSAKTSKGSVYNIKHIQSGEFQFAIAQSDTIFTAYNGLGNFKEKPYKKLRTVMSIYPELLTLVVNKNANIQKIHDIKGKIINIGNKGSGQRSTVELLFSLATPLSTDILKKATQFTAKKSIEALKDGNITGYFYMTGHPSNNIKEAAENVDIDLVRISPQTCLAVKTLLIRYPFYSIGIIPANTYKGVDKDIKTFGVKATLVTDASTNNKVVEEIIKSIVDNLEKFKAMNPAYKTITKRSLIEGLGAPFHPAAMEYYRKIGILK